MLSQTNNLHDSDFLDKEAETRVASELLKYGIIVAKPFVDKSGADLLAMLQVNDSARFIRVQSKGRSIEQSETSHFEIFKTYVTESFVCFLYLRIPSSNDPILYIFFPEDICSWTKNSKDQYIFSISKKSYIEKLQSFKFDEQKAKHLIDIIEMANVEKQIKFLINSPIIRQYNFGESEVTVKQKCNHLWETTIKNKTTGIETVGTPCPGDPENFIYNASTDTWHVK